MAPAPRPLILSGPNGAGKTTFAGKLLAVQDEPLPFLNADIEAQRLSPGADAAAAVPAGRAVLSAMADLLDRRIGFAVETTLSGRHHQMLAYRALNEGWLVDLHYLWLDSVELAVRRVAFRVASGGHDIPTEVIQRRYGRGLANLPIMCGIVSRWTLYDNSSGRADPIAGADSASAAVYDFEVFDRIVATGGTVKWRNSQMAERARPNRSLDEHVRNATRILRGAVRAAVREHYKAGRPVVYQRGDKIYERSKPGTKGRVVATVSGKRK